jgi:hypothetical protein
LFSYKALACMPQLIGCQRVSRTNNCWFTGLYKFSRRAGKNLGMQFVSSKCRIAAIRKKTDGRKNG